ncbi:hypothetical protein H257_14590 [Aphanomyces astaci]|uniref:EF-hand domain-containing protein n=1 Tax=Aphanomyces astaci TaxID=112090 RepID=W4FQH9_APHAT|nr:hypothetical protein H257_14590 [Aphanomyces astaci]ETV69742.1 hypothetical protein H257_14590 [Aphanomyces astaci]|eukprot:XP_009840757.1 hypothetical protein H257_14590 [Aphanomyces astaci]
MDVTKQVRFDETFAVVGSVVTTPDDGMGNKPGTAGSSSSAREEGVAAIGHHHSHGGHAVPPPIITEISVQPNPHKVSSSLDLKLINALKELKVRKENGVGGHDKHDPFTKILLKGPSLKQAFDSVRSTFDAFDKLKQGSISFNDMEEALNRLGGNFTKDEINDAFTEADMSESGRLTFKEFLVCLAIGFVLHRIPALDDRSEGGQPRLSIFYAPLKGSGKDGQPKALLFGDGNKLRQAFHLAVDVFLWFDMDGDGLIEKNEMLSRLHESMHEHSPTKKTSKQRSLAKGDVEAMINCPANTFITQRRFNEMDWDHDGSITFKEFLMAFESWVGVNDDDDDIGDDRSGGDDTHAVTAK